jgi:hypothetical protein
VRRGRKANSLTAGPTWIFRQQDGSPDLPENTHAIEDPKASAAIDNSMVSAGIRPFASSGLDNDCGQADCRQLSTTSAIAVRGACRKSATESSPSTLVIQYLPALAAAMLDHPFSQRSSAGTSGRCSKGSLSDSRHNPRHLFRFFVALRDQVRSSCSGYSTKTSSPPGSTNRIRRVFRGSGSSDVGAFVAALTASTMRSLDSSSMEGMIRPENQR